MKEEIDGFRRTAIKTRDKEKVKEKVEMFEERGEQTKVMKSAGYYYVYVKKEKPV